MNFRYWENQEFLNDIDLLVIGSGITGLSTAIHYKKDNPESQKLFKTALDKFLKENF